MSTRTTTGATTIPEGTSTSGQVSGVTGQNTIQVDSGDAFTDHLSISDLYYVWIYLEDTEELVQLKGILDDNKIKVSKEVSASNSAWQFIRADLNSYSVSEQDGTGGTATVDGETLAATQQVNSNRGDLAVGGVSMQLQPVTANGNGTTLRIVEQKSGG